SIDNIYRYDRVTGETALVSVNATANGVANGECYVFWMSDDGNKVIFSSEASNLSALDVDATTDYFERDLAAGTTTLLNVDNAGTTKIAATVNSVSADGNLITLETSAQLSPLDNDSYQDIYVRNLAVGTTALVSVNSAGAIANRDSWWGGIS